MKHITPRRRDRRSSMHHATPECPGPRQATIRAIIAYSRALAVVEARPIGPVPIILN